MTCNPRESTSSYSILSMHVIIADITNGKTNIIQQDLLKIDKSSTLSPLMVKFYHKGDFKYGKKELLNKEFDPKKDIIISRNVSYGPFNQIKVGYKV